MSSDKHEWKHVWVGLQSTCSRLEAEIDEHGKSPLLKGVLATASQHSTACTPRDVKQQLCELQQMVRNQGPVEAGFISSLSDKITAFAQRLTSVKQQQRTEYAALLRQEQQLLEELATLQLTLTHEQGSSSVHPAPKPHGGAHSSLIRKITEQLQGSNFLAPSSTDQLCSAVVTRIPLADGSTDCVQRSPDRPTRQLEGTGSSPHKALGQQGSSLPPEVQVYDAFLTRHGPCGGWHADDHKTFMAVLKAHRGDYNAALPAAVDALPLHTRDSVITHCRWHADLCELEMRKRVALVNWRAAKEAAKAAFHAQAMAFGDANSSSAASNKGVASHDQQQKEQQLKQRLLQQWKQEQQLATEAAQQAAEEKHRLMLKQERQQRKQRQKELKQRLHEAKMAKQQQQQATACTGNVQSQHKQGKLDPASKERIQHRNIAAVERQQQLMDVKQQQQTARQRAQQQLLASTEATRPHVDRDPGRLLSATTAAAARSAAAVFDAAAVKAAATQSSRGHSYGGFVLQVSRKATPSWVAGVQNI